MHSAKSMFRRGVWRYVPTITRFDPDRANATGRRLSSILRALLLAAIVLVGLLPRSVGAQGGRIEVYLEQNPDSSTTRIYFMDTLSGLSTVASVESGHEFAVLGDYVIYQKDRTGAVMRVNYDGTLEPHAFIRHAVDTVELNWVISPDNSAVAWSIVNQAGESAVYIAWADGSDLRQLPLVPAQNQRSLLPLALTSDRSVVFYDSAHSLPSASTVPYTLYYYLAEYNVTNEVMFPLPDEPNCTCAAAITADGRIMARLESASGQGPFALHIWDLPSGADILLDPPPITLRQAGDLLLNSNGTLAVYSAAAGVGVEAGLVAEQYALVLGDVSEGAQRLILVPGPDRYHPLAFIDGDAALLLRHDVTGGTYKLDLASGELQQVSDKRYLGVITP